MLAYEQKKLIQVVLYILNKTGGIDYYHIFKILYFAELKHLAKWGHRIIADDFYALEYGPVPTKLYDAVKGNNAPQTQLADLLKSSARFAGNDAPNVLLPICDADLNYISASEIEALNSSIEENVQLTFSQLKEKSHDSAWGEAFRRENGAKIISPVSMAKVMNADNATIEYIKEQLELEKELA